MQLLTVALALAGAASASTAGFTVSSKNQDGTCKNSTQWAATFASLQSLPAADTTGSITSARLFSSSDCNTLVNAVPAAIAAKQSLLVGIWTTDAAHFAAETAALQQAIQTSGDSWISAIAVGSEDLWRGANNASNLVAQINSVRTLVRSLGSQKAVGHVDDYSAWTNPANTPVIAASDFVGTNIHPFFATTHISSANATFWSSLLSVQQSVASVKNIALTTTSATSLDAASLAAISQYVWVTETGWAVSGNKLGKAVPSVENAAKYWRAVTCGAVNASVPVYWPADVDYGMVASFGAIGESGDNLFVEAC